MKYYVIPASNRSVNRNEAGAPSPAEIVHDSIQEALFARRVVLREGGARFESDQIILLDGDHFMETGVTLKYEDSGRPDRPLVIKAQTPGQVRLLGGQRLSSFVAVPDEAVLSRLPDESRSHVVQFDLRGVGITEWGGLQHRGRATGTVLAPVELFFNRRPMTVARWPNATVFPNTGYLPVTGTDGDWIETNDDRMKRWKTADDIYLQGFLKYDWLTTFQQISELDPARNRFKLAEPSSGPSAPAHRGRFFYRHILEELDQPGEYYVDYKTGLLYFWPPEPVSTAEIFVSTITDPIMAFHDVANVQVEGLIFEYTRGHAIEILGGSSIVLAGCTLQNIGKEAVHIEAGQKHEVISCDISQTGECGIYICAGDRQKLTPCLHRIHNCHIHHIAREGWTYFGAVAIWNSCGVTVTHNRLHDHRHALLFFRGNEHYIAFNEFYNATLESDDAGCAIIGRNFTYQGNRFHYNWFHHNGDSGRSLMGTYGVMLDDCAGGVEFVGNVFCHVDRAIFAGGGINTRVMNNLFVHCSPAVWYDERGASLRADSGDQMVHGFMKERFYEVGANQPAYTSRYPNLEMIHDILQRGVGFLAKGGGVFRNVILQSEGSWIHTHWTTFPDYFEFHDNLIGEDPGVEDGEFGRPRLHGDSPVLKKINFQSIPQDQIGLCHDPYRPCVEDVWTAIHLVRPMSGDGRPGLAELVLRNRGDVLVEGIEHIEIKINRHGPGQGSVAVPYRVCPGEEKRFAFEFALPGERVKECFDLFLFSRGERIRPAWISVPIEYDLTCRLEAIQPLSFSKKINPGRFRLNVLNVSKKHQAKTIRVNLDPDRAASLTGSGEFPLELAPQQQVSVDFELDLNSQYQEPISRLAISAVGEGVRPAIHRTIVEYPLMDLGKEVDVHQLGAIMNGFPKFPVRQKAARSSGGHIADIKMAVADCCLAVWMDVKDLNMDITDLIWTGSSIEIYGASPDRERLQGAFDLIPIGQVFLVPEWAGKPARGFLIYENKPVLAPDIHVTSELTSEGYILQALIPRKFMGVNEETDKFLFEVQVQTGMNEAKIQKRSNLFGSAVAYQDSSHYAMASIISST